MKIVVDENVSFADLAFGQIGNVVLSEGRKITNEIIKDADALIIRSVTNVTNELLNNTNIKFIGTATIGTDHVNIEALNKRKIKFANAKGCNSNAVAEYVITAILSISDKHKINISGKSIGIIGFGNVGKKVEILSKAIGLKPVVNDPPLQAENYNYKFHSLEEALSCDFITFHVPLNKSGIYKTVHLLNNQNINLIKKDAVIFNTSRGSVIDNSALLTKIEKDGNLTVLDVWENEPNCLSQLINKVEIGTAHVAGYTYEGKVIGTKMIYDQLCNFLNIRPSWEPPIFEKVLNNYSYNNESSFYSNLLFITNNIYDIYADSESFKQMMLSGNASENFDKIRKNYKLRNEFPNYLISSVKDTFIIEKVKSMRFLIE